MVPEGYGIPDFARKPRSLMCYLNSEGIVNIEMPNKQVQELSRISISQYLGHWI